MILPQIYGQLFCMLHIMNLYNLIHIISILFLDIFLLLEPNMAYDNGDHQEYLVEEFFLLKSDSFNITHSVNGENIGHQKIGYQEKKRPP